MSRSERSEQLKGYSIRVAAAGALYGVIVACVAGQLVVYSV